MDYLLIFIPYTLRKFKSGYILGFYCDRNQVTVSRSLYIFGVQYRYNFEKHDYPIVGYFSFGNSTFPNSLKSNNFVQLSYINEIKVHKVVINNKNVGLNNCHIIIYDDITLIKSELFLPIDYVEKNEGDYFRTLTYHLKTINRKPVSRFTIKFKILTLLSFFFGQISIIMDKCSKLVNLTTLGIHFDHSVRSFCWFLNSYKNDGKISLKTGNYIMSILADIISGYIVLSILKEFTNSNHLFNLIASHTENIIHCIEQTIKWLMGSPWGVKLNYPLNYILGNFFLYNIHLWWTFLGFVRPLLEVAFFVFLNIGLLGLSYQIAILADIFSIVSFHVFSIYIYAAKLYHLQVSGLYSLSRIFLGRKRNPQPGKVDSCPYTTEQLFVGTICFTVLLFLLPTTLVYYIAFTVMRLGVNIAGGIMTRARYFIQVLPLYSTLIWLVDPEFTTETMKLTPVNGLSKNGVVTLYANRSSSNWYDVCRKCIPSVIEEPEAVRWKEMGWNIVVGKLIYSL